MGGGTQGGGMQQDYYRNAAARGGGYGGGAMGNGPPGYQFGGGMTGGAEGNPMRTGGMDANPNAGLLGSGEGNSRPYQWGNVSRPTGGWNGGVQPQPSVPGAEGAKAGFTAPMMNLSNMDAGAVGKMMGSAADDGQRIAMFNAFRASQNPFVNDWMNNRYGGQDQVMNLSRQWNEANPGGIPVWNAANNSFMSPQDYYAKQMGWK